MRYFIKKSNKIIGPCTLDQVKVCLRKGSVVLIDELSESSNGPWKFIGDVIPTDPFLATDFESPLTPLPRINANDEIGLDWHESKKDGPAAQPTVESHSAAVWNGYCHATNVSPAKQNADDMEVLGKYLSSGVGAHERILIYKSMDMSSSFMSSKISNLGIIVSDVLIVLIAAFFSFCCCGFFGCLLMWSRAAYYLRNGDEFRSIIWFIGGFISVILSLLFSGVVWAIIFGLAQAKR